MDPGAYRDALALGPGPARAVVVVAHPDDETIGAGGLMLATDPMLDLRLVHLTDGAPRDGRDAAAAGCATPGAYARLRQGELAAALAAAGVPAERTETTGLPDQEAALHLPDLARHLADRLDSLAADRVLTHPYEGGHPDHDAAAFAVRAACDLLARAGRPVPHIVEMAFYHRAGDDGMAVGNFLPDGAPGATVPLGVAAQAAKRRMLAAHASQARVLAPFDTAAERFRPAPRYAFTRPPHAGTLLYETWGFAMTGQHWRLLADEALAALGLEGARWL